KRPLLNDDRFTLQHAQDIAVMEVLLNDALAGLPDTVVTQLGAPSVGTLEYLEEGKRFRYFVEEDFRGTVQFQYVVCSPASTCNLPCDTALVTIDVQNLPSVPEGLVVDDPGLNGRLIIKGISGYSRVEIAVFNRWGSLVFQENDYRNDTPWLGHFNGKALPQGAYYYSLKAWEGNTLVGGAQTGVIHLFSQE
ncbi:MAG TPA: gliding motility-associated C-terminal domain-containing protein, partial [Saprospiraceae bacterium]|nr:gliding motility-associated C-terminal domain-containing protein [Saprospiraceae bacterium]